MRKLIYLVASTIDGFIADPTRADPSDTVFILAGDHAEPLMHEYPEMVPAHFRAAVGLEDAENRHFDIVLEGRVSYVMALNEGVTNAYPHMRHYVFSNTLTEAPQPADRARRRRSGREDTGAEAGGWQGHLAVRGRVTRGQPSR